MAVVWGYIILAFILFCLFSYSVGYTDGMGEAAKICDRESNDCQGLCAKAIRGEDEPR